MDGYDCLPETDIVDFQLNLLFAFRSLRLKYAVCNMCANIGFAVIPNKSELICSVVESKLVIKISNPSI